MNRTGTPGKSAPLEYRLADPKADEMARDHAKRLREMQDAPAINARVFRDIELPDGEDVHIKHGFGVVPSMVTVSVPRGAITAAGWIEEVASGSTDRRNAVVLQANDYGATVTVNVEIKP